MKIDNFVLFWPNEWCLVLLKNQLYAEILKISLCLIFLIHLIVKSWKRPVTFTSDFSFHVRCLHQFCSEQKIYITENILFPLKIIKGFGYKFNRFHPHTYRKIGKLHRKHFTEILYKSELDKIHTHTHKIQIQNTKFIGFRIWNTK